MEKNMCRYTELLAYPLLKDVVRAAKMLQGSEG